MKIRNVKVAGKRNTACNSRKKSSSVQTVLCPVCYPSCLWRDDSRCNLNRDASLFTLWLTVSDVAVSAPCALQHCITCSVRTVHQHWQLTCVPTTLKSRAGYLRKERIEQSRLKPWGDWFDEKLWYLRIKTSLVYVLDSAIAQAVSRRPLTAEDRVCVRVSSCEKCGGEKCQWYRVFARVLRFFFPSISFRRGSPYSYIIWRMNHRPVGRCTKESQ
jgi:hypothetical protein